MKPSKKCIYALRIVLELSYHHRHRLIHISDLAGRQQIPRKFLEQIMLQLKKGQLIQSKKGPNGGYSLARSPDSITVGDVIRLVDSNSFYCTDPQQQATGKGAGLFQEGFFGVFEEVEAAISAVIDTISFAEILRRETDILATKNQALCFNI